MCLLYQGVRHVRWVTSLLYRISKQVKVDPLCIDRQDNIMQIDVHVQ